MDCWLTKRKTKSPLQIWLLIRLHRCWFKLLDVGDEFSILVTSFGCWCPKLTHFVSNIRHLHRFSPPSLPTWCDWYYRGKKRFLIPSSIIRLLVISFMWHKLTLLWSHYWYRNYTVGGPLIHVPKNFWQKRCSYLSNKCHFFRKMFIKTVLIVLIRSLVVLINGFQWHFMVFGNLIKKPMTC